MRANAALQSFGGATAPAVPGGLVDTLATWQAGNTAKGFAGTTLPAFFLRYP